MNCDYTRGGQNVQSWLSVQDLATIARVLTANGIVFKSRSDVVRYCVETIANKYSYFRPATVGEAVEVLAEFSLFSRQTENRKTRKIIAMEEDTGAYSGIAKQSDAFQSRADEIAGFIERKVT